jgi:hypothetical protein
MGGMRGPLAAVPVAAALVTGCGGQPTEAGPKAAFHSPPLVVDCARRVETARGWPPADMRRQAVRAGPIDFPGLLAYAHQEPTLDGSVGTETAVRVRAEHQVTVAVRSRGVRLLWGNYEHGQAAVTFSACGPFEHRFSGRGNVGQYTLFQGGFHAPSPRCVAFDVYVFGRRRPYHRRFPLGHACG